MNGFEVQQEYEAQLNVRKIISGKSQIWKNKYGEVDGT
jgi:hypothetical protein